MSRQKRDALRAQGYIFAALLSLSTSALGATVTGPADSVAAVHVGGPRRPTALIAPAPGDHFDEIFFRTRDSSGQDVAVVRPEYRDVVQAVARVRSGRIGQIALATRRDFDGENTLSILPRVLNSDDYDSILKRGVDQRGRALLAFLQDYYRSLGLPSVTKNGILPQDVLQRIVDRYGESGYLGAVQPEKISLFYGPDIIRDAKGRFRVIEDTSGGYMGGVGDLNLAATTLMKHVPELSGLVERDPLEFYRNLVQRYQKRAVPTNGKIVFLTQFTVTVREDGRLKEIFEKLGVKFVSTNSESRIEFDQEGAWYQSNPGAARERVGFVIVYGEFGFMDPHSVFQEQLRLMNLARRAVEIQRDSDLRARTSAKSSGNPYIIPAFNRMMQKADPVTRMPDVRHLESFVASADIYRTPMLQSHGFSGLSNAILAGRVASNITPGTEFISDKEFYGYVEPIIEHYLGEKPILTSIKTMPPQVESTKDGKRILNKKFRAKLLRDQSQFVIKRVNGRGGKDIWVGAKVSDGRFAEAIEVMEKTPTDFQIQSYVPLSVVGREITDLRVFADVSPTGDTFVTDTPWGRALPVQGDGKVNISSKGQEMTVIVRSKLKFCSMLFGPVPASAVYQSPGF